MLAEVNGKRLPMPINLDTINRLYGLDLLENELDAFFAARAEPVTQIRTSEDVVVSRVGRDLYEKFFQGYTRKQWGLDPSALDKVSAAHGATLAQVALAWLMARPSVTAPIASATSVAQMNDIAKSASLKLTTEDMKALDL